MFARSWLLTIALAFSACSNASEGLDRAPAALGDFRMGHNIVVGETAQMVPPSRPASAEEWEAALGKAIDDRFGAARYQGEGLYHFGVSVDAFALAIPGVPLVVKPRSILVISVTVWDNATGRKINEEAKQITVFENLGIAEGGLVGSGLAQNRFQQMERLSYNAALAIQRWLLQNPEWFAETAAAATEAPPPTE
jgi:hypothetical protein